MKQKITFGGLAPKRGQHRHHKIPIHCGGSDTKDNIVYLTPLEHAQEHLSLFEQFGKVEDLGAYQMLMKRVSEHGSAFKHTKWWTCKDTGKRVRSDFSPGRTFSCSFTPKHQGRTTVGRKWLFNPTTGEQKMLYQAPSEQWQVGRLPGSVNPNKGHVWWYHLETNRETHSKVSPGDGWVKGKLRNFFTEKKHA